MKRIAIVLPLMMLIFSFTSFAQMRMDPAERAKELKEQLKLSDDQTAKVQKIYEDAQSEAMAQMSDGNSGNRGERRAAMQAIMTKAHDKVKALLNDEQKAAYQKIIDERRSQRQRRN